MATYTVRGTQEYTDVHHTGYGSVQKEEQRTMKNNNTKDMRIGKNRKALSNSKLLSHLG